ncbi:MAG: hypothetical protein GF329_04550 [Candidatus Lokiarchaeota archaeon]|nr:hypothetical protein [Candidatus Lokiarchaeota archaeon]
MLIKKYKNKNENIKKKKNVYTYKKLFLIISIVIIISIVLYILLFSISGLNVVKAQLIIEEGIIEIKHEDNSWFIPENGTLLCEYDKIRTHENSSAIIILFESSIIRLDSNTEVMIKEVIEDIESTNVKILQSTGRTWNTISKISGIDNYDVQTPTTVASVRGTTFVVKVESNGSTEVGVNHGLVNVSSLKNGIIKNTISVEENESVTIFFDKTDQPLDKKPFLKDDWVQSNIDKDNKDFLEIKKDLYNRLEPYIPELKEKYNVTDEELDILIEGYIRGDFELPDNTPDWILDIIELS